MWQLLWNYYKCAIKVTTMLQLMYIHAIMACVHISTTHYGIHLQLVFGYIPIDIISMATSMPLLKWYCSIML
jgi:hypothetical protein